MTDDSQPVEKPVDGHLARAFARLTRPDAVERRVRQSRGRGLGALLPPVGPPEPGSLASAIDEDVASRHEARERVRAYVAQRADNLARTPEFTDVIDRVYPPGGCGIDEIPLLLSDLQLLIEET